MNDGSINDIHFCSKVVTKEMKRLRCSMVQKIILKKASSRLIYEMVKNDPKKETNKHVRNYTPLRSKVNKVTWYLLN
mgnify:FL=1